MAEMNIKQAHERFKELEQLIEDLGQIIDEVTMYNTTEQFLESQLERFKYEYSRLEIELHSIKINVEV